MCSLIGRFHVNHGYFKDSSIRSLLLRVYLLSHFCIWASNYRHNCSWNVSWYTKCEKCMRICGVCTHLGTLNVNDTINQISLHSFAIFLFQFVKINPKNIYSIWTKDRSFLVQGGYVSQSANKTLTVSKKSNVLDKIPPRGPNKGPSSPNANSANNNQQSPVSYTGINVSWNRT